MLTRSIYRMEYNIIVLLLLFCRTRIVTFGYRGPRGTVIIIIKKLTLNKRRRKIFTAPTVTKSKEFCAVTIRHILLNVYIINYNIITIL